MPVATIPNVVKVVWHPTRAKDPPQRTSFAFDSIEDALAAFAHGEPIVVMDDESRENEGDIIMAASKCTTEAMAWIIKHTSGYVCISLPKQRLEELDIPMMVPHNQERHRTAYTITVDYKHGTTTGISAHDRSLTARKLVDPCVDASDFTRPGHMVPLRAREGGVLERRGHTECGIDLCKLTNQPQGGVLCELVNDDEMGTMARRDDCRAFADEWGLKMITVEMLVQYKRYIRNVRRTGIKQWWHQMQYIGDAKAGTLIGTDQFGNRYFENLNPEDEVPGRHRWVDFAQHYNNATQVPAEWHSWLQHIRLLPPTEDEVMKNASPSWKAPWVENLTGTRGAYRPYNTAAPKINAWQPKVASRG